MIIKINGFQILKDATLDVDGITMVVGSTNNGKSSIVRAIESAMFNATGSDFINYDMEHCSVEINFDKEEGKEPLSLKWSKSKKGSASYTINGEDYRKLGRKNPSDILEPQGIREVVIRGEKERINFWRQMQEPFLTFAPPSFVFEFISTIMEDKKLIPVSKQISSDSKALKDELLRIEGSIKATDEAIVSLNEVEKKCRTIIKHDQDFLQLREIRVAYERISSTVTEVNDIEDSCSVTKKVVDRNTLMLDMSSQSFTTAQEIVDKLKSLEDVKARVQDLSIRIKEEEERQKTITSFKGGLEQLLGFDIERLKNLTTVKNDISGVDTKIRYLKENIYSQETSCRQATENLEAFKKKIKMCPACERAF